MLYGIFTFCLMASYAFAFYLNSSHPEVADAIYLISPLLTLLVGIYSLNYFSNGNYLSGGKRVGVLFWLALGVMFYSIGEIFWFYLAYIQVAPTSPSIADVFFLIAYPCLFIGAYLEYRLAKVKLTVNMFKNPWMLLAALGIVLVAYFGIIKAYAVDGGLLENIIAVSNGAGDLLLIISILLVTFVYAEGKLRLPWTLIGVSYVFMLIADLGFAFAGDAYAANMTVQLLINLSWMIGYFLMGKGFLSFISVEKETQVLAEQRLMAMKSNSSK